MIQLSKQKSIVLLVSLLLLGGFTNFLLQSHNSNELDFQAYAPTKLPSDVHLIGHTTYIYSGEGEHYKQVLLLTNVSAFRIGEEKSTLQQFRDTTFSCTSKLVNSACITVSSPDGQPYDIKTIFNGQKIGEKTVSWHKDNTRVWMTLTNNQLQNLSNQSWGVVIDSFQPSSYGSETGKTIHFSGG